MVLFVEAFSTKKKEHTRTESFGYFPFPFCCFFLPGGGLGWSVLSALLAQLDVRFIIRSFKTSPGPWSLS